MGRHDTTIHGSTSAAPAHARTDASSGHGGHMPPTGGARALAISGALTGVYFVVELAIGFWTTSVSVTSDAFHTFSAVGGVLIALAAGRFGQCAANRFQTFGYLRPEIAPSSPPSQAGRSRRDASSRPRDGGAGPGGGAGGLDMEVYER